MSHWGSNYKSLWHLKILEIFRNYLEEQEELQGELLSFLHCADPKSIKIRPLSFKALRSEAKFEKNTFTLHSDGNLQNKMEMDPSYTVLLKEQLICERRRGYYLVKFSCELTSYLEEEAHIFILAPFDPSSKYVFHLMMILRIWMNGYCYIIWVWN